MNTVKRRASTERTPREHCGIPSSRRIRRRSAGRCGWGNQTPLSRFSPLFSRFSLICLTLFKVWPVQTTRGETYEQARGRRECKESGPHGQYRLDRVARTRRCRVVCSEGDGRRRKQTRRKGETAALSKFAGVSSHKKLPRDRYHLVLATCEISLALVKNRRLYARFGPGSSSDLHNQVNHAANVAAEKLRERYMLALGARAN